MANFADVYLNENAENCIIVCMYVCSWRKNNEDIEGEGHLNFRGLHLKYSAAAAPMFEIIGLT